MILCGVMDKRQARQKRGDSSLGADTVEPAAVCLFTSRVLTSQKTSLHEDTLQPASRRYITSAHPQRALHRSPTHKTK